MFAASISENILSLIAGLGIVQGILLSIFIYFHPKSDHSVNRFLALYILVLSFIMAGPVVIQIIPWQKTFFFAPLSFLPGPTMYFYIRSFREKITWKKALPHYSVFIFFFVVLYFWVNRLAQRYPDAPMIPETVLHSWMSMVVFVSRYSQLFIYYFLAFHEIKKYHKSIRQYYSETSLIDLNWGRLLVNGYLIIVVASFLIFFLMLRYPENFILLYLINIAVATPYIYAITYKGITQPTLWQKNHDKDKPALEMQIEVVEEIEAIIFEKPKSTKLGLAENRLKEIVTKTIAALENEKLYQETELTLQDLAQKIEFPAHQVSYAINEGLKKNFYDLINFYRVEEAKRLLLDHSTRNFTILSVGFDAGFNSKTTFNTVFKKFTGQTPTHFRNHQRIPMKTF